MKCSIVVATYNRPLLFKRILECIKTADYEKYQDIDLVLSIDRSNNYKEMLMIANSFSWEYGKKHVILHDKRLGLRQHFIFCGNLSQTYGPIIFLEDDVVVNKFYYLVAQQMTNHYQDDERIVGISLYSLSCNEGAFRMFYPLDDGTDVFFCSLMSWAPVYFPKQWKEFNDWLQSRGDEEIIYNNIPDYVLKWKKTSFKKLYIQFAAQNKKYFAYSRHSCATNFSEPGEHYQKRSNDLQVPVLVKNIDNLRMINLSDSCAVYDCFLEIDSEILKKMNSRLSEYDFDVDLYGKKEKHNCTKPYLLTTKKVKKGIMSFERSMLPHEMNVINNISGEDIYFSKIEDVKFTRSGFVGYYKNAAYDLRGVSVLKCFITDMIWFVDKVKQKIRKKR